MDQPRDAFFELKRWDDTIRDALRSLELEPGHVESLSGVARQKRGEHALALTDLDTILERSPSLG